MARDDIADFGTYLAEERHASQNTICSYLRDVTQFSAYLREHQSCTLRQAGGEMIQDYMSWMRGRGKSAASVTRFLASVKSFYNFLLSAGAVKANPAKSISADRAERKYPEILTSKEVELFLEQPRCVDAKGYRDHAMLELLYATGIRVSELISLDLKDLNLSAGFIRCASRGKERIIPLYHTAVKALQDYVRDIRPQLIADGGEQALFVNMNGERFMNEDQCYPMSYAAGANQPKHYSWIVWDGNYWDDIAQFDTCGCSRLYPAPSGTAFNADVYDCEAMSKEHLDEFWLNPRLEAGTLKKADTLEALADMMEFDADQKATFLATVERYNGLVAAGEDTDFGKPAYRLSDVETAPFYAARIGGELLGTTHGVITDVNSRPLKNDGTPIEGLYVCGNDQGGFYPHNYPSNFTGINAGRTATFARIAAKHALGVE